MPKTFYVSVDLFITAKNADEAERKARKRLDTIAEKAQASPYYIVDTGDCEDY